MPRLVAAAALALILASPAGAESGVVAVGLPMGDASSAPGPSAVCDFALHPSAVAGSIAPPATPAMTLSPRMLRAIRVDADIPAD